MINIIKPTKVVVSIILYFSFTLFTYAKVNSPGLAVIKVETPRDFLETTVFDMVQGRAGFIWFATSSGLWRFDGINLKKYQYDKLKPEALPSNHLTAIEQDRNGYLWILSDNHGLSRFEPNTEVFKNFVHDPKNVHSLSAKKLRGLQLDNEGQLWIGSNNGINIFDTETLVNKRVDLEMQPLGDQPGPYVFNPFRDSKGNVWMTVRREGVYRYDYQKKELTKFTYDANDRTSIDKGLPDSIFESSDGKIWLQTGSAINQYQEKQNAFERFYPIDENGNEINNLSPTTLLELGNGQIIAGTTWAGLGVVSKNDSVIELNNLSDIKRPDSIAHQQIHAMLLDSAGTIWVAIYPTGLIRIPVGSYLNEFHIVDQDSQNSFQVLLPLPDKQFLIGTSEGLIKYDQISGTFTSVLSDFGGVGALTMVADNKAIVFSIDKGFFEFNIETQKLSALFNTEQQNSFIKDNPNVRSMMVKNGVLYISFYNSSVYPSGLAAYDLSTKKLSWLTKSFGATYLSYWQNKILMGTTANGVQMLDLETRSWTGVTPKQANGNYVFSIHVAKNDDIWVSVDNLGIAKLKPNSTDLDFISMDDGLPSNRIFSITEDQKGNLWLGSDQGIAAYDPNTGNIELFDLNDGFRGKGKPIYWSAATTEGDILMGGYKWLTSFNASEVLAYRNQDHAPGQILLSDFRLFNKPQTTNVLDENSPLDKTINNLNELTLNYDHSWFSLAFASSDYSQGNRLRYAYQMKGLSDKWIEADKGNQMVNFSSLSPQSYRLNIRSGDDKGWHDNIRQLKVTVLPPWWRTWQAYIAYAVILIGSAMAFYRYRTKALVKRAEELEEGIAERTKTINQLMAQKERMFANISHEFKTPLTMILNPLENLSGKTTVEHADFQSKISMMKRNSKRLLRMVDQLLELSKLETTENHKRDSYSLRETLNLLITSFQPLVDSKNMALNCTDYEDVVLSLKPDSLEIILTNLISNAIKYTPEDGSIHIDITKKASEVVIAVKDSGIGIDEESQPLIFNRFTRAEDVHGENIPGAGIGLALVKELVETHKGTITLESELGEGSTFTVRLPIVTDSEAVTQTVSELSHSSTLEIDALHHASESVLSDQDFELDDDKQTILLIDDNVDMLELLLSTLSEKFNCLTAQNGTDGLALAKEHLPDLVISDVMMPGISGFEVVKALKEDELTCHLPVVLLTAKGDMESRIRGWSEKADEYLEKPFNSQELCMRIDNLLDIRRLLRQRLMREFSELQGQAAQIHVNISRVLEQCDAEQSESQEITINAANQRFLERLNHILESNYQDETMDVTFLAKELAISPRQLSRKMKAVMDLSPVESIRSFRLKKAATLLAEGHSPGVVAHQVGFSSHSYFSKCFKAQYNCLPSSFN